MAIWTIAKKDLRLLLRDRRALIVLLAMPFIFILILGLSLGEGFGQKPDDRLQVSILNLDAGNRPALVREAAAGLTLTPISTGAPGGQAQVLAALALWHVNNKVRPDRSWSEEVMKDLLAERGDGPEEKKSRIRVELLQSREEAESLILQRKRSAILVFGPTFSERVTRCSFLADGINPFYREGVKLEEVDAVLLKDPTQMAAASIIEQVAQVTLLRVILPWMIGRAFERLSEERFIDLLCHEVHLPVPRQFRLLFTTDAEGKTSLEEMLRVAGGGNQVAMSDYKRRVGSGVQSSLQRQFEKYNLTGKTWEALTKSDPRMGMTRASQYKEEGGFGVLRRGAVLYQTIVPSYTVMFAFFLVLTVGWLFVSERRQGTLKRLQAAPLSRSDILLGKLLPCFALSLVQGVVLLGAGKLVFGMSWGPEPLWLVPVVVTTSLAAVGLAMFVAALARNETQVAIYGTLLVLVLAGISGCLMPRALMPENMRKISLVTPHAWALDAYSELLLTANPNYEIVGMACLVLAGFGAAFILLAWWALKLE